MDWDAAKTLLDAPLDASKVKKPTGNFGPKGDYIEGWHAIAEANRIFGHGSWSYTITTLSKDNLCEGKDGKGNPQWQAAYTCIVRVVVGDAVREDVGFGSGFAKQVGDAIEGATKEAVTDALKRALRTFGNPFGLALYDKTRANVATVEPKVTAVEAEILEDLAQRGNTDRSAVFNHMKISGNSWADLPADLFITCRDRMQAKVDQIEQEAA